MKAIGPDEARDPIPPDREDGWERLGLDMPFMRNNGPIWLRIGFGRYEYGFLPTAEIHANLYGNVHGGMLAAFADFALGHACRAASGDRRSVTVSLDLKYIAAARPGDWIGCEVEIVRRTGSLYFSRGDMIARGAVVTTASGVWKILGA